MPSADYNIPIPDDRTTVVCLYCNRAQDIGRRALSITCRYCNKALRLEDLRFKEYQARRLIETCGFVTIEKKGNVSADKVNCGGLIVRGKLKGNITCRGPVRIGPDAEIKGDLTAPALEVGPGAVLEGYYDIGPKPPIGVEPGSNPPAPAPPGEGR